jgi:hypothetical protein
LEVSEFPRLLFHRGQTSLTTALIMNQERQAWLPSLPRQSLRAALGATKAEAKRHRDWGYSAGRIWERL